MTVHAMSLIVPNPGTLASSIIKQLAGLWPGMIWCWKILTQLTHLPVVEESFVVMCPTDGAELDMLQQIIMLYCSPIRTNRQYLP